MQNLFQLVARDLNQPLVIILKQLLLARAADEAAQQQHVVRRPFRELVRCPRAREQVASLNRRHDEAKAVQRGQLRAPVRERNRCRRDVGNGAVRVGQLAINFAQQLCGDESGRGDDERVGLCRAALDPHVERIADALHRSHRAMTLDVHVELSRERINQFARTSPQG